MTYLLHANKFQITPYQADSVLKDALTNSN